MDSGNGGGTGEDLSSAPGVNIFSNHGSHVTAQVLSNTSVRGGINISYNYSGTESSAPAATSKPDTDAKSVILAYKVSLLPEYRTVAEYNSLAGQDVLLQDRYTELLMVEKHRRQRQKEEEIRGVTLHQVLTRRDSKAYERISVDKFFSPMGNGEIPRTVILQGHSGMGKTFTAQMIMHDWMSGTLFDSTFDAVFHLKCKELNLCTQEKSLMELLKLELSFQPTMKEVLTKSPQRVLFLIDGFDELRFSLDITKWLLPSDSFTRASVKNTLSALLQGHILSESSLLVTSRSTASDRLSTLLKRPQRYTEILGFSEDGVLKYFQRFFKDTKLFTQAYNRLRSDESLFAACFVPIICWIVCTVLKEHYEEETDDQIELTTTTSVFVHFVSTLLEHHCQGLKQPVPTLLRSLGQLAERGILEQHVLFEETQVLETVLDSSNVPFLCKFLLKKNVGKKTMFSFMHLSFQEFFTALFYATTDEKEGWRKVESLLQRIARGDHHLLPVILFLFGLSNKELGSTLKNTLVLSVSPTMHTQLEEWILRLNSQISIMHNLGFSCDQDTRLDIFNCLYERHEEELARKAMELWESFQRADIALSKTDCWVLRYCFHYCPEIRCLHLINCNITAEKLKMLKPVLSKCKALKLQVVDLSDDDVEDLIPCLGEGNVLRELQLIKRKLTDKGVRKTLDSLYKQSSLDSLKLEAFCVTLSTVEVLFDLIQKKSFKNSVSFEAAQLTDAEDADLEVFMLNIRKDLFPGDVILYCECGGGVQDTESSEAWRRRKKIWLRLSDDSEMATINWRKFFHCWSADNLGPDEHVEALLSFLGRVPGLKGVRLDMGPLTERSASGVISLIQACPTLTDFRWCSGEQGFGTDSEEGLKILHQSQHHLTWVKCQVPTELCPDHIHLEHPHQRDELRFTGDSVQH